MLDKIIGVFTTALVITGVGMAFRKDSTAPKIIEATFSGVANLQKAAYGASK